MAVMGANTNWKANDEESGNRRLSTILQIQAGKQRLRQLMYPDAQQKHLGRGRSVILFFYIISLKRSELRIGRKTVQEHGILRPFQHPTCFRDTPTSYTDDSLAQALYDVRFNRHGWRLHGIIMLFFFH